MTHGIHVGAAALVALCVVASARVARAQDAPLKPRVLVYDLSSEEAHEAVAAQLTEGLLVALGRRPEVTVLGEGELRVLLSHATEEHSVDCAQDAECLARLAQGAGVDVIVTGHAGRLGRTWLVTLNRIDARRAVVERRELAQADNANELLTNVGAALRRLFGFDADGAGAPVVAAPVPGAATPLAGRAAVVELRAHDVSPGIAGNLTQLLSLELKRRGGLDVISGDEITTLLRYEGARVLLDCDDDPTCLAEIAGALGVDHLVTGSVGRLGEVLVVTLKLMDARRGEVTRRAAQSFRGAESELAAALRVAASDLLDRPLTGTGVLAVSANVAIGRLSIDGGEAVPYPLTGPLAGLAAGKHGLHLAAPEHRPLFQEAYIFDGQRTDAHLTLEPTATPWYESWWFWTAVGAVTVAVNVTVAVLAGRDPGRSQRADVTWTAPLPPGSGPAR